MKHRMFMLIFSISNVLLAMDDQKSSSNQILWFVESILHNSKSDPDFKLALIDLKKSTADQKYKITNKDSLKILRIYELLAENDDAISEPIRNIIKDQFPESPKKKIK
ncbi:hypothetical protein HYX58_05600 [Candidatus Dependentiae bacterium]|nr:hypothetical protein [Candidatus Dependentiae bacterium]